MRTLKGQFIQSWYCPKCHKMFFTPKDEYQVSCPYCDHDMVSEKAIRIMVDWPTDIPYEFMVRLP